MRIPQNGQTDSNNLSAFGDEFDHFVAMALKRLILSEFKQMISGIMKIKACVRFFLSNFYFFHQMIAL